MDKPKYLFPQDYMADPAAHVFNGKLYIYPSHDWESGIPENDNGDHFNMKDYHCLSVDNIETDLAKDEGIILKVEDIAWAGRQLWDSDVVEKNGKYYLIYSMKDKNDIFHLGVAIADRPEGPFRPEDVCSTFGIYPPSAISAVTIVTLRPKVSFATKLSSDDNIPAALMPDFI